MATSYDENIFRSLRRIIRAIDLHSRQVYKKFNLTVAQQVCLRQILTEGSLTPGQLADRVYLSQATVTGIVDRLETRGLIQRERTGPDRRRVTLNLTTKGLALAKSLPLPLQDRFAANLAELSEEQQKEIDEALNLVVTMMEAQDIKASPVIATGGLHLPGEGPEEENNNFNHENE